MKFYPGVDVKRALQEKVAWAVYILCNSQGNAVLNEAIFISIHYNLYLSSLYVHMAINNIINNW